MGCGAVIGEIGGEDVGADPLTEPTGMTSVLSFKSAKSVVPTGEPSPVAVLTLEPVTTVPPTGAKRPPSPPEGPKGSKTPIGKPPAPVSEATGWKLLAGA